jgi:hypothetical protein
VCLIFRQNGGDSLLQQEENPIPQLFHIALWIWKKKPFRTNFFRHRLDPVSLNSQFEDARVIAITIRMEIQFYRRFFTLEALYDILRKTVGN